jgi:predicted RNA-binding Zn-ribbon protein involved in translation (DUF1610 family)
MVEVFTVLKPRPGAKNQSTMFPAQNGGIPGPSPLMKAAFAAAKKMGADTRGETMADATNYVLANKLYWTCAKTGRVFERVGKAPPTLCELCGAENHVESGHCRRASVEEFMAFVRELRVVATAKTYPENECPGCGRGEEVWESKILAGLTGLRLRVGRAESHRSACSRNVTPGAVDDRKASLLLTPLVSM